MVNPHGRLASSDMKEDPERLPSLVIVVYRNMLN